MLNPHRGTSPQSSPFLGGGCSLKPHFSSQAAARGENPRASPRGESGKDNPIGDRGKEGEGQEGLSSPFLQIQKFSFSRHLKEEALPFLPESIGPCGKAKVFLSSTFSQASPLFSRSELRFLLLLLLETTFRFWARPEKRGSRAFSQPL